MLTQEDEVDIHALRRRGWSISAIARHVGLDRKTVRVYLDGKRRAGVRAPAGEDSFARYAAYCTARLVELVSVAMMPPPTRIRVHFGR